MKSIYLLFAVLFFLSQKGYGAFDDTLKTKKTSALYVGLGSDTYYGSYFYGFGYYGLTSKTNLLVFGISRSSTVGLGIQFALKPNLFVSPVIGISNGKSLSGGANAVLAEGIVPGFLSSYYGDRIYYDQGLLYYNVLQQLGPVSNNYLWYWVTAGYNISSKVTAGVHAEQLYNSYTTGGEASSLYFYLGPYAQANFKNGANMRFTTGFDFNAGSFARVSILIPVR
ncbi:MAG: hypothetical protein JWO58_2433 [Chitinophagaceae bacterium]|nr:hypothetical protein [Chitinophagaceae bacterium]